jgi:hypothetical protein
MKYDSNASKCYTGTPPLTRFFGSGKNLVKGKLCYRRSILVLKHQNGEYESSKTTFCGKYFFSLLEGKKAT